MKSLGSRGAINVLMLPLVILLVLFLGATAFGFWAYAGREDYKSNTEQKIAVAVSKAQEQTQADDAAKYAEEAKQPYDTYIGPAAFGNVTVKYPRTWSAYVVENANGGSAVNAYFQPNIVPSVQDVNSSYALRVELVQQRYDQVIATFNSAVQSKKVTVTPYKLANVPSVVGARIEGQIKSNKQGTMIVLPLRNLTLEIWTESNSFKADLDNVILPNFRFDP